MMVPLKRSLTNVAAGALVGLCAASLPLFDAAPVRAQAVLLQRGESFTIDRMEFPNAQGSLALIGLSFTGSSLPRAEIEAILRSSSVVGLGDRLARLNAERMTIARIEWRMKVDTQETVTVYENFEARGIRAGVIDTVVIPVATQTMKAGPPTPMEMAMKLGRMSVTTLDLAGMFRWFVEADPSGSAPMKTLYGRYEMEGMEGSAPGFIFNMGRATGSGVRMRPMKQSFMQFMQAAQASQTNPADKAAGLAMFPMLIDLFQSVDLGDMSIDGMRFSGKDPKNGKDVNGRIGRMTVKGGDRPAAEVSDIDISASDGYMRLARFGGEGPFYSTMFVLLAKAAEIDAAKTPTPAMADAVGKLKQAVASVKAGDITLRLEGLDGDFPPGANAKSPDRVKLKLDRFEATTGSFVGFFPTRLDYSLSRFSMPLPNDPTDQGLQTLRMLGINELDISARIRAGWEEARQRFLIEDVMADLGRFGRVSLKGEVGGIPRQVFENPEQNWPMLMGTANAQSLGISVENKGGVDALIAMVAQQQGQPADQMRFQISSFAPAMVAGLMPGHPDAPALADTLTRFIRQPGVLSLVARTVNPAGLTVPEIMGAAGNPAALLPKIRIEAQAR